MPVVLVLMLVIINAIIDCLDLGEG